MAVNDIINQYAKQAGNLGDFGENVLKGVDIGSKLAERQASLDEKRQELEQKKVDGQFNKIKYFFDKVADGDKIKDSKFKNQYFKSLYENSAKFGIELADDWKAFFQSTDDVPLKFKQEFSSMINSELAMTPAGKYQLAEMYGKMTGVSTTDALPDVQKLLDYKEKIGHAETITGQGKEKQMAGFALKEISAMFDSPGMSLLGPKEAEIRGILSKPEMVNSDPLTYFAAYSEAKKAIGEYTKRSDEEKLKISKDRAEAAKKNAQTGQSLAKERMNLSKTRLETQAVQQAMNNPTVRKYKDVLANVTADLAVLGKDGKMPTVFEGKEVMTNLSRQFAGGVGVVPESRRKEFQKQISTFDQELQTLLFSKIAGDPTKVLMKPKQVELLKTVTRKYIKRYQELLSDEIRNQIKPKVLSGAIPKEKEKAITQAITGDTPGAAPARNEEKLKYALSNKQEVIKKIKDRMRLDDASAEDYYKALIKKYGGK